jgi:HSP20 family protein
MLLRFDPFREAERFADQRQTRGASTVMPMDAVRRGDEVVITFDLPGVDPSSFDVTVERNVLAVSASRVPDRRDGDDVLVNERRHGTTTRQLFLGDSLDPAQLRATYDQGVLTVTIPVAATAQPRKVEVAVGNGSSAPIETSGTEG